MFVTRTHRAAALRQEGHVYRHGRGAGRPSVRRAKFIDTDAEPDGPPSGGQCLSAEYGERECVLRADL
jgi:hypothetical protein